MKSVAGLASSEPFARVSRRHLPSLGKKQLTFAARHPNMNKSLVCAFMRSAETAAARYGLPSSSLRITLLALGASLSVFGASVALQWVVYINFLHRTGQWRFTGTALATILTFIFLCRWQLAERERQREIQRRLAIIGEMNDRIRNALQIIQVTSYLSQPSATDHIREAVDAIDVALRDGSARVASPESNLGEMAVVLDLPVRPADGSADESS
jgi:hypothetical protein